MQFSKNETNLAIAWAMGEPAGKDYLDEDEPHGAAFVAWALKQMTRAQRDLYELMAPTTGNVIGAGSALRIMDGWTSRGTLRKEARPPAVDAAFARMREERARLEAERPKVQEQGEKALKRLFAIACRDSGQCRHVAAFLLGLYNGQRFPFDLTDLRCLDHEIFEDCLAVLRMDWQPKQEVHRYIENGGERFEELAQRWAVKDRLVDGS